jgi:hypothetical protein
MEAILALLSNNWLFAIIGAVLALVLGLNTYFGWWGNK